MVEETFDEQVASGRRFQFGRNWQRFLALLDDDRIAAAEGSLREMLERPDLEGLRFLDAGSGSGLFSLSARRLGASVHSFDFDPESVACTAELRRRYSPDDREWRVESGSVLDDDYLRSLGEFDVVYSWGVLHHTGSMWEALDRVSRRVAPGGMLYVALYNDQGARSRAWGAVKRLYNRSPRPVKAALVLLVGLYFAARSALARALAVRRAGDARSGAARGMSRWYDLVDWVGGYPYEVAAPDEVFEFCRQRGFDLRRLRTVRGHGCNEYVLVRAGTAPARG